MHELRDTLVSLERGFWTEGADYYRQHADGTCLVAFTGTVAELSNEELAATVGDAGRWRKVEIDVKGFMRPAEHVAILSYEAKAERSTGETYAAIVSSCYVEHYDDDWKLAFHQQTESGRD